MTSTLYAEEKYGRVGSAEYSFFTYKPIYFGLTARYSEEGHIKEGKFQISFKYEILDESSLFFSYTQRNIISYQKQSSPMSSTEYTPELFYVMETDNASTPFVQLGIYKHQSNGEPLPTSLQWETSYVEPHFVINEEFALRVTLWVPFLFQSEDKVTGGIPEIFDYYGGGEAALIYTPDNGDRHTLMYREGRPTGVYALEYQWDIKLNRVLPKVEKLKNSNTSFFLQAFNGYGETLQTYNQNTTRVIIGISLTR